METAIILAGLCLLLSVVLVRGMVHRAYTAGYRTAKVQAINVLLEEARTNQGADLSPDAREVRGDAVAFRGVELVENSWYEVHVLGEDGARKLQYSWQTMMIEAAALGFLDEDGDPVVLMSNEIADFYLWGEGLVSCDEAEGGAE